MAVLTSTQIHGEPDPRISFHLKLLDFMKYSSGQIDTEWYETRLGIEVFNTRVDRPDPHICKSDIEWLVKWLRQLVQATDPVKPFTTMEPMFRIDVEPGAGPTFLLRILLQAWGTVPMFFSEDEGVAILLPCDEDALTHFSKQLEDEMAEVARLYQNRSG
jgi:hypothetical protein